MPAESAAIPDGKLIERRVLFKRLTLAFLGSCWTFISCAPLQRNFFSPKERLREDLARLDRPPYSEEGVPVILVCENLAAAASNAKGSREEGKKLAAEFREIAATFAQIERAPAEKDIPKLIEVLSYREFGPHNAR